ncbi:LOW QUALITY PROTEIN: proteasome maturation protein-like [Lepus europaeus]|uniref:LOW QUALITY PROTEIN: proteasome maturation protein-like n=1 Tax=Lepus europaeus TaxID=9983 RepID=UPI002B4A41A8|nr:LOW QUALITY PROTEIN: proteasome maturation protein-like [Lepus europaeus]
MKNLRQLALQEKRFVYLTVSKVQVQDQEAPLAEYGNGWSLSRLKINARGLGSQLKDSIPVTELSASGPFESHDLLRKGFSCVKNELLPSNPLELSEKNFQLNQEKMNFSTLRNIQGLFAPLKLQMELKAVQQVQRLPFLTSSNLSLDILRGNDETIGFEDILNDPSQSELMGEPHLMVEHKLGLL